MHENLTSILLDLYLFCKNNVAPKGAARGRHTKKQRSHAGNRCLSPYFYLYFTILLHCAAPQSAASQPRRAYSSSETGSHHSLRVSSPGTSRATWENQLSLAAPCQCLTSGGMTTVSPGASGWTGLPHSWYQPRPAVHSRICPPPLAARWMCQVVRQPGPKGTLAAKPPFWPPRGFR